MSETNTDVDLLKAGPRAPLPFIPPLIIIWVYLHLLFLQRSVLDLSLHILFTNLSSPFQKMSLFFSPLKLSSNSTLSKAESHKAHSLRFSMQILFFSCSKTLHLCSWNFWELCEAFSELMGPPLSWQVDEDYDNYINGSLHKWACTANVGEGSPSPPAMVPNVINSVRLILAVSQISKSHKCWTIYQMFMGDIEWLWLCTVYKTHYWWRK